MYKAKLVNKFFVIDFVHRSITFHIVFQELQILGNQFSNHKSSFQITNQVQNQFVFKSHMSNCLLVMDPLDYSYTLLHPAVATKYIIAHRYR